MNSQYYQLPIALMGKAVQKMDVKNPKVYGNFLAQSYYYVCHSTRLLSFAAGLLKKNEEPHFRRFIKHIAEENAHEVLAERDLKELGLSPSDFAHLPETKALWEPQYYKILHESPLSLMGYIIALEYFSSVYLPKFYEAAKDAHGEKASLFLKVHAEEDPDHTEKAIALTSQLSPELQEMIMDNVVQTAKSYTHMITACGELTQPQAAPTTTA